MHSAPDAGVHRIHGVLAVGDIVEGRPRVSPPKPSGSGPVAALRTRCGVGRTGYARAGSSPPATVHGAWPREQFPIRTRIAGGRRR
jgi:hypothetical protein